MTFGERLITLRKERGFNNRNDFAEYIGMPSTTLRNYETNVREPGHVFLKQMAEIFKVSVDYLLCTTNDKTAPSKNTAFTNEEFNQIKNYRDLDNHGKEIVDMVLDIEHKRWVSECKKTTSLESNITAFKKEDSEHLKLNAVHDLPNATEGEKQYDDDIMNDENF